MADEENNAAEDAAAEEAKAENLAFEEIEEGQDTAAEADSDVFDPAEGEDVEEKDLNAIYDVPVQVSAVLGRSSMLVSQLLKLGRGAVVELDRRVGEPIDVYVNNRLVARGEVVVVDEKLGITMTEIVKSDT